MSVRMQAAGGVTTRQRLALFHGTGVETERALAMSEGDLSFELFISNGVRATNLTIAELRPMALMRMGVDSASKLRRLGFDALHLTHAAFCSEANAAFGAEDVESAFLTTPADAVCVAGSDATHILNISTRKLLEYCAGAPQEALAVLQQMTGGEPLKEVPVRVLLDAGLRAPALSSLGYTFSKVVAQTGASSEEMLKLGYRL